MSGDTRDTIDETKKLTVEDIVEEIERLLEPGVIKSANVQSVRAHFKILLEWMELRMGK
jgi:hypothetical protein